MQSVQVQSEQTSVTVTVRAIAAATCARQGEWLFVRETQAPADAGACDPVGDDGAPLSYYDRRAHLLIGDAAVQRADDLDVVHIAVGASGATLRHDEHGHLAFPPNSRWRVVRQRVADPLTEAVRWAVD